MIHPAEFATPSASVRTLEGQVWRRTEIGDDFDHERGRELFELYKPAAVQQFGVTIEALRAATQWAAERARFEAGAGAANQQEAAPAPAAQLATRDPYSAPGIPYERGSVPDEMTVYANWRPDGPARPERGLTSKQQAYRDARGRFASGR